MKKVVCAILCLVAFLMILSCEAGYHGMNPAHEEGANEKDTHAREPSSTESASPKEIAPPSESGLKAAFVDDNVQYNWFLSFLERFKGAARHLPIAVQERIVLEVHDRQGNPLPNATIRVSGGGDELTQGKSLSDGTFLFFPSQFDPRINTYEAEVTYGQVSEVFSIDRQGMRRLSLELTKAARAEPGRVPLDLVFILDTTGSMGEEIKRLQAALEIIIMNVASMTPTPVLRLGMVLYKDRGDAYVTRVTALTEDLQAFEHKLAQVKAQGGGDTPEDLQEALRVLFSEMDWNDDGIRLGFMITDAAPHLDYRQRYTYVDAAEEAKQKGVKLFSVGAGGLDINGEYTLRQISQYTSANYVFLTYGETGESEGGRVGSVSHHTGSDFQTDKLESILMRIVKKELYTFTGRQHLVQSDNYFQATKVKEEPPDQTLDKLFLAAIAQLVDYSGIAIEEGTPASATPVSAADGSSAVNAEYFDTYLMQALSRHPAFRMVERANIQEVLDELEYQLSDLVDESKAAKVGNFMGAELLVTGKLYEKTRSYELFLKLLRVETGEVLAVTKMKVDEELGL